MENAKNSFIQFINYIGGLYCSAYAEIYGEKIKLNKGSIIKLLFGTESDERGDSSRKLNNESILFTSTYARNFLEKMICFNSENNEIEFWEIPLPSKIDYSAEIMKSFRIKLSQYYEKNNPYPWFRLPEFSCVNQLLFHQMILLSLKAGLKYRKYRSVKNEIKCFDTQIKVFYEYIANKDRIVFNGSFRSGKTTFLKAFVNAHFKEMYYYNSNYKDVCINDMFLALNPDLNFWNEEKTKRIINNNPQICIPELPCDGLLEYFPEGKTLIIDHVKDISIMEKFKDLPCKLIFVVNLPNDLLPDEITYNFDNKDLCREILNRTNIKQRGKAVDSVVFNDLYNKLGKDVFLYKCIETCQRNHKKHNLFLDLYHAKQFDDYENIFKRYRAKYSFSVNNQTKNKNSCKNKSNKLSSGDQLGKHIVQIYSGFFNDIQNKKDNTKIFRDELQILRLFCRFKEENVSLSQLRRYFHDKTFYNHLYELNWINGEEIVIPSIVAFAFNRKELYIQSYTYYLRFIEKVLDSFEYDTLYYVDRSTFHSFFKILIKDYEKYVSVRNKTVDKISIEPKEDDVNLGYSARIIKRIYETGIWYSFKYNDKDLYDFIMIQAKKLDDFYEWKWFISFWESIQPVEKPINRSETILSYLNNNNEKILDPHSIYFVNVYNIKLTNIEIINFFQRIFRNDILMKDRDSDDLNKLFKKMESQFRNAYCCTYEFNRIGKENKKDILDENLYKMECFCKTLFYVYQFIANILSEKEFQSSVCDLMCKYRKICMNSTILLQAYLILVCSTIFKHKKYDIDIQLLTKELKLCCNYLGDLPNNINEIVKITRSYLEALDV